MSRRQRPADNETGLLLDLKAVEGRPVAAAFCANAESVVMGVEQHLMGLLRMSANEERSCRA